MQSVYRWKFIWAQKIDTLIKLGPERKSEVVVIPVLQAPLIIKFLPIVRSFVLPCLANIAMKTPVTVSIL